MSNQWARFEGFELDLETGDLLNAHGPVDLQPLPARVLALLVSTPGVVVTRDEIRERIWGELTFAADQALNTAVRQIRMALGDEAGRPKFVATVPRVGYRFIARTERTDGPVHLLQDRPVSDRTRRSLRRVLRPIMHLTALAIIVAVGIRIAESVGPVTSGGRLETPATAASLPPELRIEYAKARELLSGSDTVSWRAAAVAFDRVREAQPEFSPATAGAGQAALRLGEDERAAALAAWTLAADSANGEAFLVLGWTLLRRGNWVAAKSAFGQARRLAPDLAASYSGLAVLEALDGHQESAAELVMQSVELEPMSAIALGDAGYIALWAGRPDLAIEWCDHARDLLPEATTPRSCLLDAYHVLGRADAEREQAVEIMRANGADSASLESVISAPVSEALRLYRAWQVNRLDPAGDEPPALAAYLAFLRMQDGDKESAVRLLGITAQRSPVALQFTLLDPVLAPLRKDPRLVSALDREIPAQ